MEHHRFLFWNVDTQNDFMNPDGDLYVKDAEKIKPVLKQITDYAKSKGIKVVNTADWHYQDSAELSEKPDYVNTFHFHCIAQSRGAAFIPETEPEDPEIIWWEFYKDQIDITPRNIVLYKDAFDVFEGNPNADNLAEELLNEGYEQIFVYGVAGNVCVKAAVEGLKERGFEVTVFEDAVKGLPGIPDPMDDWKKGDRIGVTTFASWVKQN